MIHWIKQGPGSILSYTFQTISRTGFEFASTCTLTAEAREKRTQYGVLGVKHKRENYNILVLRTTVQ